MEETDNLFTLEARDVPLCVQCLGCGHPAAIEATILKRAPGLHEESSLVLVTRRLRCRACGSRAVKAKRPYNRFEVEAFVRGE